MNFEVQWMFLNVTWMYYDWMYLYVIWIYLNVHECNLNVFWMFMNVIWMCFECIMNVLWMYHECIVNVSWMYCECILNVSWMWMCRECEKNFTLGVSPKLNKHLLVLPSSAPALVPAILSRVWIKIRLVQSNFPPASLKDMPWWLVV